MRRLVLLLAALVSVQFTATAQYAKWIVEPIYDKIGEFNANLASVQRDGKWGYINKEGEEVIACKYYNVTPFVDGIAIATSRGNRLQAIIHENGEVIEEFVTQTGNEIKLSIDPRYPYFGSGMLLVTNGLVGYVKGVKYTRWGYLDQDGVLQIPIQYYSAMPFCEDKAAVADTKMKFSYIDKTGRVVVPIDVRGGRLSGAFGFYKGKAYVSDKKKLVCINNLGIRISEYPDVEPDEIYYDIKSNQINCGDSKVVVDSLGRINRVLKSNGFILSVVEQLPAKEPIKSENYFMIDGEKMGENISWITESYAIVPFAGKMGVVMVQDKPIVDVELKDKSIHAIFGNTEPLDFKLINDTEADIHNLKITCNDELVEKSSIPTSDLALQFSVEKLTDAEVEVVQKKLHVTQRGVLLMDKTVDVIIVDEPAINIIGRNDLVYFEENKTASLSVDIQNTSKYQLKDAVLTMNNYQTKITVEPNSIINCPTFFGVVPNKNEIEISISVKPEKAQVVTKHGTMLIDNEENKEKTK